jgi:release factor glutamine methyltransferase
LVVLTAVSDAANRLMAAGLSIDDARREAALLARFVLGWDAAAWLTHQRESPPAGFQEAFDRLIARRASREPLAYLIGEREFYGRAFRVTPDVLIPRPETEFVIDEVITLARARRDADTDAGRRAQRVIVDIGTGSGCIAVTLALELPQAKLIATDTSVEALRVAQDNARRHGVAGRIEFRHGPFLAGFADPVDLVVTNPPYVPESDRASLAPEVAIFEPAAALFAGRDGLDVIRELVPRAATALGPGGALVMEIGLGQATEVQRLVEHAGLTEVRFVPDLQRIPRVITALRPV